MKRPTNTICLTAGNTTKAARAIKSRLLATTRARANPQAAITHLAIAQLSHPSIEQWIKYAIKASIDSKKVSQIHG